MDPLLLTAHQIGERYGLHRNTLYKWEKQGLLHPVRTPGGRRKVPPGGDRAASLPRTGDSPGEAEAHHRSLRPGEYEETGGFSQEPNRSAGNVCQGARLDARGHRRDREWGEREAAGLVKILNRAKSGELERVVVEYEDRLARFGLGYIRRFLEAFGVELLVLNGKESEEVHRELAEDLVAVVSSFDARIYGRRGGKRGGKVKDGGKEG
jgi:putative resolvase